MRCAVAAVVRRSPAQEVEVTASLPLERDEMVVPRHDIPRAGRSGFCLVDGRQVHYLEWGRWGSPPVLCLHGGGQTAYMFEELGASLVGRYHVLAPDLPNHGDSDSIDGFSPDAIAATKPALLDEFGLDGVHVVGASLGGMAGLVMAAALPERVRSISLIDVGPQLEKEGVHRIIDFMRAHESFGSLEEAADEIARYLPRRKEIRPESLTRNLRLREDGRWVWKHGFGRRIREAVPDESEGDTAMADIDAFVEQFLVAVRRAVVSVRCPVMVLRGEESDVLSDQGAQAAVDLIPDARLEIVEKAGHLAAGDNPRSTVGLIAGFLEEQENAGAARGGNHG